MWLSHSFATEALQGQRTLVDPFLLHLTKKYCVVFVTGCFCLQLFHFLKCLNCRFSKSGQFCTEF